MTYYTYSTTAVIDPTTQALALNATDGKFVTVPDAAGLPIYDLNLTPIAELTSNSLGQSNVFRVQDQRHGYAQFGTLLVHVWADEIAAELETLETFMADIQDAVAAAQAAQAAAELAAQNGGSGGGLPVGTDLDDIPNGATRLAMTSVDYARFAGMATGATNLQIGTGANNAKRGDYTPSPAAIGAVQSMGGSWRFWVRRASEGQPSTADGAIDNTDVLIMGNF